MDPTLVDAILAKEFRHDYLCLLDAADPESGLDADERAYCRGEAVETLTALLDARTRLAVGRLTPAVPEPTPETCPVVTEVENRLYTVDEAAAFLRPRLLGDRQVVAATVRRWAREGRLRAGWSMVAGGRRSQWRISPRSLRDTVERGLADAGTYLNPYGPDAQTRAYFDSLLD